jgi:hypothetical protein
LYTQSKELGPMQRKSHIRNYTKSLYMSGLWFVQALQSFLRASWNTIFYLLILENINFLLLLGLLFGFHLFSCGSSASERDSVEKQAVQFYCTAAHGSVNSSVVTSRFSTIVQINSPYQSRIHERTISLRFLET